MINIEYVKDGINKIEFCETFEEVEKFVEENNLIKVSNPENENEYRLTK
jgi:hypothetical protein